jgi:hypothetical protein
MVNAATVAYFVGASGEKACKKHPLKHIPVLTTGNKGLNVTDAHWETVEKFFRIVWQVRMKK